MIGGLNRRSYLAGSSMTLLRLNIIFDDGVGRSDGYHSRNLQYGITTIGLLDGAADK